MSVELYRKGGGSYNATQRPYQVPTVTQRRLVSDFQNRVKGKLIQERAKRKRDRSIFMLDTSRKLEGVPISKNAETQLQRGSQPGPLESNMAPAGYGKDPGEPGSRKEKTRLWYRPERIPSQQFQEGIKQKWRSASRDTSSGGNRM